MLTFVQAFALVLIAAAAVLIAMLCVLLSKRIASLIGESMVTVQMDNRLAPKLERLFDEIEPDLATHREVTTRLSHASERIEAVTEKVAGAVERILHPIQRLSDTIDLLQALIAGVGAGAAAWRRRRDGSEESRVRVESNAIHPRVGEGSSR